MRRSAHRLRYDPPMSLKRYLFLPILIAAVGVTYWLLTKRHKDTGQLWLP